jgi:hypothetical protein
VSVLPLADVHLSDHPGLFRVRLDWPQALSAAATTREPPALRPGRVRVAPNHRHKRGLQRYCAGCARETEHVVSARDRQGSIPSIRWPTQPAAGTTICLSCGQWRAASSQPRPPAWSSWPRSRVTTPNVAVAATSADTADDSASATATENEGMRPTCEPRRLRRSSARLTRTRAVAR